MPRRFGLQLARLIGPIGSAGCPAVGLALLGVGAGVSAGTGVSYTPESIAYNTFKPSEEALQAATLKTLTRMDITVNENQPTGAGRGIAAAAAGATAGSSRQGVSSCEVCQDPKVDRRP